jgi:hypothetical protein
MDGDGMDHYSVLHLQCMVARAYLSYRTLPITWGLMVPVGHVLLSLQIIARLCLRYLDRPTLVLVLP